VLINGLLVHKIRIKILKETFTVLLQNYTNDKVVINKLWTEVEQYYSKKKIHYHTLSHLDNVLNQLLEVKDKIENWDTILFTLFYHDIIYQATKSNNEEESAKLADERMKQLFVPSEIIKNCITQILATKAHLTNSNMDTNYFTDADLSVIGQSIENYTIYYKNVRKEYLIYPDLLYNPGRKKVLTHFLEMDRIYKTDYFHAKYEKQAKLNLQAEFDLL
jgi:predicted metal-dependent HD superfamily phosphohydrolase